MKLRAIRLRNVKRFGARGIALEQMADGLNVLAAENEFGKSTIFQALRLALFEKHTTQKNEVADLQPYQSTDGPSVEIDLDIDAGRYRVFKRFLSRKTASVIDLTSGQTIARADDAEKWLQNMLGTEKAHDGPVGLLWVAQGTSLENPEPSKDTEAALHALLSQEVAQMTGGDRLKAVQRLAQQRLHALVTTKTGKPTGEYRDVEKNKRSLLDRIARLKGRAEDLHAAHNQLHQINSERDHLQDAAEIAKEKDAITDVMQRWQAASQAAANYESTQTEISMLQDAEVQKKDALERATQALSDMGAGRERKAELEAALAALDQREKDARAEFVNLKQAEEAQRERLTHARKAAHLVHGAHRLDLAKAEHARLIRSFELANEAEAGKAAAEKTIAECKVTDADVSQLQSLHQERVAAQATCAAEAVHVSVHYTDDRSGRVRIDGTELVDGKAHVLTKSETVELDGIGRMAIRMGAEGSGPDAHAALQSAEMALQSALKRLNVASVDDARTALDQKNKAATHRGAAEKELALHAPDGLNALEAEIAQAGDVLQQLVKEFGASASTRAQSVDVEAEETKLEDCQSAVHRSDRALTDLEGQRKLLQADLAATTANVETLEQGFGSDAAVRDQIAALQAQCRELAEKIGAKAATLRSLQARAQEFASLSKEKDALEQKQAERQLRLQDLATQSARLEGSVLADGGMGIGEELAQAQGELETVDRKLRQFEQDRAALETLLGALAQAEHDAQSQFLEPVMAELRPLLAAVIPDADVRFTSSFKPDTLARGDVHEPFDKLSGGTQEQIAILSRLAFARFMARRGQPMPVILDDALVYSDDARIAEMFRALQTAAGDIQLIVLSCRQNTFRALGGATIKPVEWLEHAA